MAKIVVGVNDLSTTHPALVAEWHPAKNERLTPHDVSHGSGRRVWWMCSKNKSHEWRAPVSSRTSGSGCPYCNRPNSATSENNLAVTFPELAAQWHPTKNGVLTPSDVRQGSNKKVWWICKNGHEWPAVIESRARGVGCPYCWQGRIGKMVKRKTEEINEKT